MTIITGTVTNGVVVPNSPLPEGVSVEIHFHVPSPLNFKLVPPSELRKMSREKRQAILAEAAELAEEAYREDKNLTDFDAFGEEETDDNETDSR